MLRVVSSTSARVQNRAIGNMYLTAPLERIPPDAPEAFPTLIIDIHANKTVVFSKTRSFMGQRGTCADRGGLDRVAVPIIDADAHATFYLSVHSDAPQRVRDVYEWASRPLD